MLSVLIETLNDEERLARTLATLIPAAMDGTVREVIVCDGGSVDQTRKVADATGCIFLTGCDAASALRRAKSEWVLLLEAGCRPSGMWPEAIVEHLAVSTSPASFKPAKASRPNLFRRLRRNGPLQRGLLITKRQALSLLQPHKTLESVARAASARRLDAEIHPAGVLIR